MKDVGLKSTAVGRGRPVAAFAGMGVSNKDKSKLYFSSLFFDAGKIERLRHTAQNFTSTRSSAMT